MWDTTPRFLKAGLSFPQSTPDTSKEDGILLGESSVLTQGHRAVISGTWFLLTPMLLHSDMGTWTKTSSLVGLG